MRKKSSTALLLIICISSLLFAGESPLELYDEGRQALWNRDYYKSLEFFKQALKENPSYVDARKGMAEAYFLLGEYSEALSHAEEALKGARERVDLLTLIGRIYLGMNRLDDGEYYFKKALSIEPNNAEAAYGRAEIAVFRGNYSEGTALFERSLTVNPDSRRALLSLSLLEEETGDLQRSLSYLNRALEYFPQDASVLEFGVGFFLRQEDWSRAEDLCLKWMALDPDNKNVNLVLGTVYQRMGRHEEAIQHFKDVLAIRQEEPLLWYRLGRSFDALDRHDDALISFKTIALIDPGNEMARIAMEDLLMRKYPIGDSEREAAGEYHRQAGRAYERRYLYDKAFDEYRKGRLLSPLDYQLWEDYAGIQRSLGYENRYRDEMTALKKEGYRDESFLRIMELLESSENESFLALWEGPLVRSSAPVSISFYFNTADSRLIHEGMEHSLMNYLSDEIIRNPHYEIREKKTIREESEAYSNSHRKGTDFYFIFNLTETDRTVGIDVSLFLSRTGVRLDGFKILRSGNLRVTEMLRKSADRIIGMLPLKGTVMGVDGNRALLDLGSLDQLEEEQEFILLRKDSGRWGDEAPYLEYDGDDLLGTVKTVELQENVSIGEISRNSPFDLVNAGDEIFILPEDTELPLLEESGVNEELKEQLLRLY